MKEVYNHQDPTRVGYYKSILDDAGIANFIRNQHADGLTMGSGGGVMFNPTLCVTRDEDYKDAVLLLAHHEYPVMEEGGEDWICPKCSEEVPGDFGACWNCGAELDGECTDDASAS